jgi:hypothetical protein
MNGRNGAAATGATGRPSKSNANNAEHGPGVPLAQGVILVSTEALREIVTEAVAAALAERSESRPVDRQIVGPTEMARMLDVSRTTLHRLRVDGCPAVKLGDCFKFSPSEVMAWLKARGQK